MSNHTKAYSTLNKVHWDNRENKKGMKSYSGERTALVERRSTTDKVMINMSTTWAP